jgi:hypothetical protein
MIERYCPRCRAIVQVIRVAVDADGEYDHDEFRCRPGGHLFVDPSSAPRPLGRGRRRRVRSSPPPPCEPGAGLPS